MRAVELSRVRSLVFLLDVLQRLTLVLFVLGLTMVNICYFYLTTSCGKQTVLHYSWIPFIIYVGYTHSNPQPSLIKYVFSFFTAVIPTFLSFYLDSSLTSPSIMPTDRCLFMTRLISPLA